MKAKKKSLTTKQGLDEFLGMIAFRGSEKVATWLSAQPGICCVELQLRLNGGMNFEVDMQAALVASMAEPAAARRVATANDMLACVGLVSPNDGNSFSMCVDHVKGDGFCFFRELAAQLNLPNNEDADVYRLAACAFCSMFQETERYNIDSQDDEFRVTKVLTQSA